MIFLDFHSGACARQVVQQEKNLEDCQIHPQRLDFIDFSNAAPQIDVLVYGRSSSFYRVEGDGGGKQVIGSRLRAFPHADVFGCQCEAPGLWALSNSQ